jgi:hypothetical protein
MPPRHPGGATQHLDVVLHGFQSGISRSGKANPDLQTRQAQQPGD